MYRALEASRVSSTSSSPSATSLSLSWIPQNPWMLQKQKIFFACSLLLFPMIAFTTTILGIVFSNKVDLSYCPYPEFCPNLDNLNSIENSTYYVDFPTGRLAFVSSLSSIVSFALVAPLMTMYGFIVARQLLGLPRHSDSEETVLTPHETSTLIRLLNAETSLLWGLTWRTSSRIFYSKFTIKKSPANSSLVRNCLCIFALGLFGSLSIQLANIHLHVVMRSISATRVFPDSSSDHQYSRSLAPWCFDDEGTFGTSDNKFFFGCGVHSQSVSKFGRYEPANDTGQSWMQNDLERYVSIFTDVEGVSYSVVKPDILLPEIDWRGHTYGTSTKCAAIPQTACEKTLPRDIYGTTLGSFNCSQYSNGTTIAGKFSNDIGGLWFEDWHRFGHDPPAFDNMNYYPRGSGAYYEVDDAVISNTTFHDSDKLFRNPWQWIAQTTIIPQNNGYPQGLVDDLDTNPVYWNLLENMSSLLLSCNTTVWDVEVSFLGGEIAKLSQTKSNGSVAGIVSGASVPSFRFFTAGTIRAMQEASRNFTGPHDYIAKWELHISKAFTLPLVMHTVPAPPSLVLKRMTSVITKLPAAALWLLVIANLLFAILGLVLATLAVRATSPEVHQVHTRLSTAGLAAQLFDWQHARKEAKRDSELFKENVGKDSKTAVMKNVSTRGTPSGGAEFVTENVLATSFEDGDVLGPL